MVTQDMGKDIYAMLKSDDSADWCVAEGSVKTEKDDGSATCVITSEGAFADLKFDEGGAKPTFTVVSPGVVRDSLDHQGHMGGSSAEAAEAMKDMFEGRALTIRFGGKAVTDTNLTINDDGTQAEIVIPFLDLIGGTADRRGALCGDRHQLQFCDDRPRHDWAHAARACDAGWPRRHSNPQARRKWTSLLPLPIVRDAVSMLPLGVGHCALRILHLGCRQI